MNRRNLLRSAGALVGITAVGGAGYAVHEGGNRYYSGPVSDHFDGVRFFNPDGAAPKGFGDFWKWRREGERQAWPENISLAATAKPAARVDDLTITMVGHATMLIQMDGLNILTDPVWSERASPVSFVGPKRVIAPGIAFEDLPPIDLVLLSHCHYDHMDLQTLTRLQQTHDPLVITPLGNDTIIKGTGLKTQVMDWGQSASFKHTSVHCLPCHHWGARGMKDRSMALWASFVLTSPKGAVMFIGDTGFDKGRPYQGLASLGPIRMALLPIGAYAPEWFMADQHQNPAQAVEGFRILGARYAVGHHWGTIQLTDEGRDDPAIALHQALGQHGIELTRFRPLQASDVWEVPSI